MPDNQSKETPVSPKVTASTLGASGSVILLYLLGQWDFIADWPDEVKTALFLLIVGGVTFIAGWLRTDPFRRNNNTLPPLP
jgi:hypothetical protein